MNVALNEFRSNLSQKSRSNAGDNRELLAEAKRIAKTLYSYGAFKKISVRYLSSSKLSLESGKLVASRGNINIDKIPCDKLKQLISLGKGELAVAELKLDNIFSNFASEVAEICFETAETDRSVILSELAKKKKSELQSMCENDIKIDSSITYFSIETKNMHIHKRLDNQKVECSIRHTNLDFLNDYQNIKDELISILNNTFIGGKTEA